jgi:[protein-PII] uridylyltransferase
MLYLLTYADMRAVGPGVLTPWQAVVLHELYGRTLRQLTGGRLERPTRAHLADRMQATLGDEVPRQAVMAHLAMMSDRYMAMTTVQRMAEHVRMLHRLDTTRLATELFHHPDLGSSDLVVVTRDLPGLFSLIAGTLAAHGVNIISAQIATRADGIAIDTFQVSDPTGEAITAPSQWARVLDALAAVVAGEQSVDNLLARRRAGRAAPEVPAPPRISIDNSLSDQFTVVEIKCADRVGLLYLITRTLSAEGCDIVSARIATEIDQAFDTFYVHDGGGGQIDAPEARERLRGALERALVQPL